MPLCGEVNLCPKINIDNIICWKKKNKENDSNNNNNEINFKLVQRKQKRYKNFIPFEEKYIYLKVLYDGKILCYKGLELMNIFGLKEECLKKTLNEAKKCHVLFREYICPVFSECIKDGEIYQFDFEVSREEYSCCFYPCILDFNCSTVDIIIRLSQHISPDQIKDFIVRPLSPES